ncbi:MAG TPA: 2-amino-4-hydroxy-6-hydroxymethyldihydropteridine diphosphokinase [Candidatus Nitrosotalea sp.]|nr:2-amino-4-hydroxy-6-hydroxymethyldihydropteridine diphosphokinase [Candidatus Nitrosotalea sp.]
MSAHRAYVGIGTNLGDRLANVDRAFVELEALGSVRSRSSLYRTVPWGKTDQPWFLNAVALLETEIAPHALFERLQGIERAMGRKTGIAWGPRMIDLDLLLYDELEIAMPDLQVPHPRLLERAFVLVPLAEIDERFAEPREALQASQLAGVVRVEREMVTAMPGESGSASERVRALADFLAQTDVVRVRITRDGEDIEVVAAPRQVHAVESGDVEKSETPQRVDTIKADLVGIFHVSRPAPIPGDIFDGDRELGYIEALGIRTPVHSMGAGTLVTVATEDGKAVEYGQPLFMVARAR